MAEWNMVVFCEQINILSWKTKLHFLTGNKWLMFICYCVTLQGVVEVKGGCVWCKLGQLRINERLLFQCKLHGIQSYVRGLVFVYR